MAETVVVFGVSGQIGSSVAAALSPYFQIKGVSRDPNSAKCRSLSSNHGIEISRTDINDPNALDSVLAEATGCFVMTHSDFSETTGENKERQQGIAIGKACQRQQVKHVVYSTQISVVRSIGMRAQHMDAKADVEREFRQMGLPITSVIIPLLYENLVEPPLRPFRVRGDCYSVDFPVGDLSLYMISARDIGPIVLHLFQHRENWLNKTLSVCGDKKTVSEIAACLSAQCHPLQFRDAQFTLEQWEKSHQFPGASDFTNMFSFYSRVDQKASLELTARLHRGLMSFDDWASTHTQLIVDAMSFPDAPPKEPWACL